jgi:hypothetical protein
MPGCDVYVYNHVAGHIECCMCSLSPGESGAGDYKASTPGQMAEHLLQHRAAGHTVPEHVLEALADEARVAANCGLASGTALHELDAT